VENQFTKIGKEPTVTFHKKIHVIRNYKNLVEKQTEYFVKMKPSSTVLNAQLQVRKRNVAIRPVAENINAP
jgi:hypothetical protein